MLLVEHTHAGSREEVQLGTVFLLIHFLPHAIVLVDQTIASSIHETSTFSLPGIVEENAAAVPFESSDGNGSELDVEDVEFYKRKQGSDQIRKGKT
jgi:hypothetical protein